MHVPISIFISTGACEQTLLSRQPLPCSPAVETALQPLIWCSESVYIQCHIYIYISIYIYIYIYVYAIYIYIHTYIYTYIYIYTYVYIYIYIYIIIYTHIHPYLQTPIGFQWPEYLLRISPAVVSTHMMINYTFVLGLHQWPEGMIDQHMSDLDRLR